MNEIKQKESIDARGDIWEQRQGESIDKFIEKYGCRTALLGAIAQFMLFAFIVITIAEALK